MKASSESGEWASLISIGCFSARGAGWVAGMAWLRPFHLAMNDPVAPSQSLEADTRHGADQGPVRESTSDIRRLAPGAGAFRWHSLPHRRCDNKYLE